MGARVNGAFGFLMAVSLGVGCAGRSQRIGDDDDDGVSAGGSGGAGGSSMTGGGAGGGSGGAGGTISTGGGATHTGGAAGAFGGAGGSAGAGNTAGVASAGSSGAAGQGGAPPLADPIWFTSGSLPLSERAYQRTVAQLLGLAFDDTLPRVRLVLEPGVDPMRDAPELSHLSEIARAEVDAMELGTLLEVLGCVDESRTCAELISLDLAMRAYRRRVEAPERATIVAIYDDAVAAGAPSPIKEVVVAVLSSPHTQWLRAVGTADELGNVTLDDYEIASLLSYGLTGLPPDAQLRETAESGQLRDILDGGRILVPSQRRAEAERLLQSADGVGTYQDFIRDWFGIKDAKQLWFYDDEPALADAMLLETNRFIQVATFENSEPVSELLSASWSILSAPMVEHYGLMPDSASAVVNLYDTRRRGLLHHASFLASRSNEQAASLIARSLTTLSLLCEDPPMPPLEVPPIPPPEPAVTYRERLSQATATAACQGCHAVLDPIAFAFGKFDNWGAEVELDNGFPIDTTGSVQTFDGLSFAFADSADLALQLASEPRFAECFNRNLVRAFAGAELDDPVTTDYVQRFPSDGAVFSMSDTLLAWVESEHFVRRTECCDLK